MPLLYQLDLPAFLGQAEPLQVPALTLILILAAAIALSIPRVTWRWFGLFTTLVHELGHAFGALVTGRRVTGIHVRSDHSGSTVSLGGDFSSVFSAFFGYPAPALVGYGLLWTVFTGYTSAALAVGTIVILLTLIFIRNVVGFLVVAASAAVSVALWVWTDPQVQGYAMLVLGIALLVGAVRGLATVVSVHTSRRRALETSDAYILFRRTRVPSPVWLLGFALLVGWCLWGATTLVIAAV
ncbi:M50 family metallopeptidase [Salinibacterium sp. ZJ454]|uniref:M50 family metallopeptidase n=1 Tax=Salinibacterium sp. ZJ454 TaxID=2708339 RepID=UPI00141DF2F8|nr:M50 family metallopeptidase [Salinibacterium sp. ZJ454]